jgi:hypothetical protein
MKRAVQNVMAGVTAAWLLAAPGLAQDPLPTVASLNVCTDQLAMALAAPGQLKTVSALARDPMLSAMPDEAKAYPVNRGLAEEVFTLKPDLIVTGTFSLHNTTGLLKRLGFRGAGGHVFSLGCTIHDAVGGSFTRPVRGASSCARPRNRREHLDRAGRLG